MVSTCHGKVDREMNGKIFPFLVTEEIFTKEKECVAQFWHPISHPRRMLTLVP